MLTAGNDKLRNGWPPRRRTHSCFACSIGLVKTGNGSFVITTWLHKLPGRSTPSANRSIPKIILPLPPWIRFMCVETIFLGDNVSPCNKINLPKVGFNCSYTKSITRFEVNNTNVASVLSITIDNFFATSCCQASLFSFGEKIISGNDNVACC